jgi:hypothetical protein
MLMSIDGRLVTNAEMQALLIIPAKALGNIGLRLGKVCAKG